MPRRASTRAATVDAYFEELIVRALVSDEPHVMAGNAGAEGWDLVAIYDDSFYFRRQTGFRQIDD